ncbi:MAG: hypothetical protein JOZ02_21240 [Acidobacteria bacterium]|nr:hypothetical protein [Acidobacteriota bacterium]
MRKIDRLGWAAGFSFTSYGLTVGVRVSDPAALGLVAERLPPGWKPSAAQVAGRLYSLKVGGAGVRPGLRQFSLLYGDIALLARSVDFEAVLDAFESDLKMYVAEFARRRVFVHAGVVGWRGRAVIIPGASLSGKTTLVAELVKAGADYYSDEYAVLDARGRVHPYPQPLQVRESREARQTKVPPESFGGRPGRRPLAPGLVVSTSYKAGARWRPRHLSVGHGLLELLSNTVPARRCPREALTALKAIVGEAPVIKGARGEAARAADEILNYLETEGRELGG